VKHGFYSILPLEMKSKLCCIKKDFVVLFSVNLILPGFIGNTAISLCRKAVEKYLTSGETIEGKNLPDVFGEKIPVFVSLKKGNQTRGCAGTFSLEDTFAENLIHFSIIAAAHDTRYRPISQQELKDIRIQITIPQQTVEIPSIEFYNPETEGLIVKKQDKLGIVLPKEAKTSNYALRIGLRNAGIEDKEGIKLFKFKAQIFLEEKK